VIHFLQLFLIYVHSSQIDCEVALHPLLCTSSWILCNTTQYFRMEIN